jgi:hypothetical protein
MTGKACSSCAMVRRTGTVLLVTAAMHLKQQFAFIPADVGFPLAG